MSTSLFCLPMHRLACTAGNFPMTPLFNTFSGVAAWGRRVWRTAPLLLALALGAGVAPTWAGGDHDHGHDHDTAEAPAQAAQASAPAPLRFVAASDHFEAVGVLQGRHLTLYLDHASDNRPVEGAPPATQISLTLAGRELPLRAQAPGTLEAEWPQALPPGAHAVSLQVQVGNLSDQLDAVLQVPDEPAAAPAHGALDRLGHRLSQGLWWGVLAVLLAVAAAVGWRLKARARAGVPARVPAALLTVAAGLASGTWAPEVQASPGHDHGDEAPAQAPVNASSPRRLPDGRVLLPKPVQRQWALRTQPVRTVAEPPSIELPGQVQMDPQSGGRVQALVAGRLQAGPQGFPQLGQTVRKGQVLAEVVPAIGTLERSGQQAQVAELNAALAQAERRLVRLQALSDTVPAKDLEAARIEASGLRSQVAALTQGLRARDVLVAPVSGVIASAQAVAGQVVEAGSPVFEVIDPQRLRVEALVHDPAQIQRLSAGSATSSRAWLQVGGQAVPLRWLGSARSLREQALPLAFAVQGPALSGLAVGQTVKVWVQAGEPVSGQAVPAGAVQRSPSNLSIVWVKQSPEHFEPRVVTTAPFDGAQVRVTSGLRDGERVVTQGASLLNQTR